MRKLPLREILLVLLGLAVLAAFIVFDPQVRQIDDVLAAMSPWWLSGAFACVLVYWIGDNGMYLVACAGMGARQGFFSGLLTTMIGFFYSAITPLSSGGQPFQVLQMRARGTPVGTSTSVLMVKFLGWHVSLTSIGLVSALLRGRMLMAERPGMFALFAVGYLAHLACVALGVLLLIRPGWVERAGVALIGLAARIFFPRKPGRKACMLRGWADYTHNYRAALTHIHRKPGSLVPVLLCGFAEVSAYLSVTYFVYRGLGFAQMDFLTMFCLQAMLSIAVAFVPLPGASGASEGGFYALFSVCFGSARLAGMLLWRVLTYYSAIVFGLAAVIVDGLLRKKREG